mmetsp:Transcript_1025/g.2289  ORF Transcript_1025/g.2289 Transcript_1025/m.2289 type:complete len:394 (+) Transcript_1025:720-1901(+)
MSSSSCSSSKKSGRSSRKVVPRSRPSEKARRDPPCCSVMALAKARPKPLPPPDWSLLALNCVPTSNTVWSCAGVIPTPVSTTSTTTRPLIRRRTVRSPSAASRNSFQAEASFEIGEKSSRRPARTVTDRSFENLTALLKRFRRTCRSRGESPTSFWFRTEAGRSDADGCNAPPSSIDLASARPEKSSLKSVFCFAAIIWNSAVVSSTIDQIGRIPISNRKTPIWILSMLRRSFNTPTAISALLLTSPVNDLSRSSSSPVSTTEEPSSPPLTATVPRRRSVSPSPSFSSPVGTLAAAAARFFRPSRSWWMSARPMLTVLRGVRTSWLTNRTKFLLASNRLILAWISFRTNRSYRKKKRRVKRTARIATDRTKTRTTYTALLVPSSIADLLDSAG